MHVPLVIAASGIEGLIWLVLALIWGLAQVFAAAKKKRSPGAHTEEPPESEQTSQQVREFLEALTGQQIPPPPPPTGAIRKAKEAVKKRREEARPRPMPVREIPAAHYETPPLPPPSAYEDAAQRSLSQRTVLLPSISSMKLRTMRLASLSASGSLRSRQRTHPARPPLQGRQNLKSAMLARIILGPPKSMGG